MIAICEAAGYGPDRIQIDPSVVRGLEYYTGPVYEVELTFDAKDEDGRPVRFGSVGGGGRYDGLVSRFRGEPVPATGFSIGVSRLLAALRRSAARSSPSRKPGPVVVTVLDRDRIADYQRMVASLRAAPASAPNSISARAANAQLKYADKRGSPARSSRARTSATRRAAAGRHPRSRSSAPSSPRRARTAPTISNCASAPSSPRPRRSLSRGCATCWSGAEASPPPG